MKLTRETARSCTGGPEDVLCKIFGSSVTGAFCASYLSLSGKVIGAAGLPFYAPLSEYIRIAVEQLGRLISENPSDSAPKAR